MTSGKLLNFQETFTIGDNIIGNNEPCFIIAEAGLYIWAKLVIFQAY